MSHSTLVRHRNWLRDTDPGGGGGGGGNPAPGTGPGGPLPGQGGGDPGAGSGGTPPGGDGFKPITSQEEFDQRLSRRLGQERAKYADYDTIKVKAQQFDALEAEARTEHEQQLAATRETAEREATARFLPELVKTRFEIIASGKLTGTQVDALLEDVDLSKYVGSDGKPDVEKIKRKIDGVVPGETGRGRTPDFGQGSGRGSDGPRKGEAGAAEATKRFGPQKVG